MVCFTKELHRDVYERALEYGGRSPLMLRKVLMVNKCLFKKAVFTRTLAFALEVDCSALDDALSERERFFDMQLKALDTVDRKLTLMRTILIDFADKMARMFKCDNVVRTSVVCNKSVTNYTQLAHNTVAVRFDTAHGSLCYIDARDGDQSVYHNLAHKIGWSKELVRDEALRLADIELLYC